MNRPLVFPAEEAAAAAENKTTTLIIINALDICMRHSGVSKASTLGSRMDGAGVWGNYSGGIKSGTAGTGGGTQNSQYTAAGTASGSAEQGGGYTGGGAGTLNSGATPSGETFGQEQGQGGEIASTKPLLQTKDVLGIKSIKDGEVILSTIHGDVDARTVTLEGGITADTLELEHAYGKAKQNPRNTSLLAQLAYEMGKGETSKEVFANNKTNEIDYKLVISYVKDMENITGLNFSKNQIEQLKNALRNKNYSRLSPVETLKQRNDFNRIKNKLILEWETNARQVWPTYSEDVVSPNTGKVIRKIGEKFDAHHIIENSYGGEHEWWNIYPAKFPYEHQLGIHRTDSPANKLFE